MLKLSVVPKLTNKESLVIFPVFEEYKTKSPFAETIKKIMAARIKSKDFKMEEGSTYFQVSDASGMPERVALVCLGKKKEFNNEKAREFGAKALKIAKGKGQTSFFVYSTKEMDEFLSPLSEGLVLASRDMATHKTGKEKKKMEEAECKTASIVSTDKAAASAARDAMRMAEGVFLTRDLVTQPANILTPAQLEKEAREVAKQSGAKITVFDINQLKKMGAGLILAVNAGTAHVKDQAARLVVLDYNPQKSKDLPIALVGKGIIFDTGGVNLKPTRHIEDMHQDMAGAATVLGVFRVLKSLGIKKRVLGVMPITENAMGSMSYRPSDIVKSYSGLNVEIGNTDAEGRLVLADALAYTEKNYKPKHMLDFATLTGACVVALGEEYAGLFGNDEKLQDKIMESSKNTDELMWKMPIHPAHEKSMKSKIADLKNDSNISYHAGASTAAAFLKNFVGKTKWAHFDIAGTAYVSRPKEYQQERGTGFAVRLVTDLIKNI